MAWVKDWSQMGAGLGELRADVREYIDDLFEGVQERVFATYGIVPDYDWPLDSGATPTDDFYPLAELYGANESRTYNLRDDLDGVPSETTFTNRRCDLIQRFMDLLMDRNGATTAFLDHTDNGGNWDGTTGFPPFWSESGILTDIGDATRWKFQRLPAGGGELYAWGENLGLIDTDWPGLRVWLKQQYEILNRLLYTPFTVGWPRDVALPTEFTRNRSVTGPEASEAAAIAQTSIDWAAASPVTLPGGDPNTRPSASYRVTGAVTYSTQLNTYVAFANTDTNAEFSYISGLVDFYIDSRVPTEPNMAGGTVFEYDNNGYRVRFPARPTVLCTGARNRATSSATSFPITSTCGNRVLATTTWAILASNLSVAANQTACIPLHWMASICQRRIAWARMNAIGVTSITFASSPVITSVHRSLKVHHGGWNVIRNTMTSSCTWMFLIPTNPGIRRKISCRCSIPEVTM